MGIIQLNDLKLGNVDISDKFQLVLGIPYAPCMLQYGTIYQHLQQNRLYFVTKYDIDWANMGSA